MIMEKKTKKRQFTRTIEKWSKSSEENVLQFNILITLLEMQGCISLTSRLLNTLS